MDSTDAPSALPCAHSHDRTARHDRPVHTGPHATTCTADVGSDFAHKQAPRNMISYHALEPTAGPCQQAPLTENHIAALIANA